jgi:hypothetical protein
MLLDALSKTLRRELIFDPAAIEALARYCDGWRQRCCSERELEASIGKKQERIRKIQDEYRSALADLRTEFDKRLSAAVVQGAPDHVLSFLGNRIALIDRDINRLHHSAFAPDFYYLDRLGFGWTRWQDYAGALVADLRNAMRTRNPDFGAGVSNNGPIARALVDIIKLVTGEQITCGSIATQLKAQSARARRDQGAAKAR